MEEIVEKDELKSILYKHGLRNTPERYLILENIYKECEDFTALDIYLNITYSDVDISLATIYNTLKTFINIGLIEQIPTIGVNYKYRINKNI